MFLVVVVLVAALAVPMLGGRLSRLADVRARLAWTLLLALALQVLAINVPGVPEAMRPWLQLASYPVAGVFVVANRHLPGMVLIGVGVLLNVIAISANGGVMPASASALDRAGLPRRPGAYTNSALVERPKLGFLGDVFAIPEQVPLHNVFSLGDVVIGVGVTIAVHGMSGSHLYRTRPRGRHLRRRRYRGRHERPARNRDAAGARDQAATVEPAGIGEPRGTRDPAG